jgi:hypothetical protein
LYIYSKEDISDLSKAIISKPGRGRNKKKYVAAGQYQLYFEIGS